MCLELCIKVKREHDGPQTGPPQPVANWEECAYFCQQEDTCGGWTFGIDAQGQGQCFRRASDTIAPFRNNRADLISGLKDCITGKFF